MKKKPPTKSPGCSRRRFLHGASSMVVGAALGATAAGCRRSRGSRSAAASPLGAGSDPAPPLGSRGRPDPLKSADSGAPPARGTGGGQGAPPARGTDSGQGAPPARGTDGGQGAARVSGRARVVLVRHRDAVDPKGGLNLDVIRTMLDTAVTTLTGASDPTAAWRRLVQPGDRVGVKTNVWRYLRTPPAVEAWLVKRITDAGVPQNRVTVDDRGARTTLARCTALINVRPLRTHHWAGIGGCLKNPIMFVERPSDYHPDSCADLGAVWNLPVLKGKTRLNLLLVLTPQFYGRGPHHFDRRFVWPYRGILASFDPVAIDAIDAELLQRKRLAVFDEERPMTPTHHIELAERRHRVGIADRRRIDLVRVGWRQEILL